MDDDISTGITTGSVAAPFRVLALDGGGIRGFFAARLLERLVERAGRDPSRIDFGTAFQLIVGTSTGALIGSALAAGIPLTRIAAIFRTSGAAIFPRPAPMGWTSMAWCVLHWRRPSANAHAFRTVLESLFGATTLGELFARRGIALCLPATDVRRVRGHLFATPHQAAHSGTSAISLVNACMASCAAPMLLPPVRLDVPGGGSAEWCDGGLWATSPVLVALAEALGIAPRGTPIEILSVGTAGTPLPRAAL
ncbi:MAG TPA: patatin-like phospholipase family protein, partial [Vicinamibacterales bacterium]